MKIRHRMMNLVCIQTLSDSTICRIRHADAEELVIAGQAVYVPKHVWRDVTDHKQRVINAHHYVYRAKKGSNRGMRKSTNSARRFPTAN